jgi:peptidoglycan/xylan/chitin deacetylase (PgdA/CDA1 family)
MESVNSIKQKFIRGIREIPIEAERLWGGKYPRFVTDVRCNSLNGEIPVIMFHSVQSDDFREKLEYLRGNGYDTLNMKDYLQYISEGKAPDVPSVLLTFDDGESSLYRVAYPLLKEYGLHAVAFVVPYFMREQPESSGAKTWCSWPEILEMDRSGYIDIQSHTYYHDRVFIQPHLLDFYHPLFRHNALGLDVPWVGEGESYSNDLKWGTPIYQHASRFTGHRRLIDDEVIRQSCIDWVESRGGATYFKEKHWKRNLTSHFHSVADKKRMSFRYETEQEQAERMREGLVRAKTVLEEKLNKDIRYLCYPYGNACEMAVSISKEAGYLCNFWCDVEEGLAARDSRYYIRRVKDDYLMRLPGKGRKSLMEIFREKLQRRIRTLDLY